MNVLLLAKTIILYAYPLITLIGLITNSISFVIFSRKSFQKTIFSTYFRILLLFQTLNLVVPIDKMLEYNFNIFSSRISLITCKLRAAFAYVNYANAAWYLVIISLDRYLSISFSNKFHFRKKMSFHLFTSIFIIGFNYLFYLPTWFYYLRETRTNLTFNETETTFKCKSPGIWFDFMDLFQSTLIPFLFMTIFTSFTIKTVYESRKKAMHQTRINSKEKLKNKLSSKDVKFALISIANNILFLLMNLPYFIIFMLVDYTTLLSNRDNLSKFLFSIEYLLVYINLTLTFFINYFVNSIFKKEFLIFLNYVRRKTEDKHSKSVTSK